MLTLQDIRDAATRLRGQVANTPFVESRTLSEVTGARVYLKFENLQFTASFKERGACNRLAQLSALSRADCNRYGSDLFHICSAAEFGRPYR